MSESPQPGTENDYVDGNEVSNSNEQELNTANQMTGQGNEEPSGGPGNSGPERTRNENASNNGEEGSGGSGGGTGGGSAEADVEEPSVEEINAQQNEPDEPSSAIEDQIDFPERDEQLYAQADAMAEADALESGVYEPTDSIDYGSETEVRDALENRNINKSDPPLVADERKGYRPVRGKKK